MSRKPADAASWLCFLALVAVLATAEGLCAALAYDTLGEVTSGVLMVAVALLNLLPLVLFAGGLRAAAVAAALALALAIVPYQLMLGRQLLALEHESSRLIGWAYWNRLRSGRFPADLKGYSFSAPWLREHFTDYGVAPGGQGFGFSFWVGSRGTSHSFGVTAERAGGWGYYPD